MPKDGVGKSCYYDAANFLTQITGSPTYNLDWYGNTNLDMEKQEQTVKYDYGYDKASNLISLNVSGGSNFTFASDGDGRRVTRTSSSPAETFSYHYSVLGLTLEQKNGVDQAKYVRLPNGVPLAITNASGTFYYLYDASGNVAALLGNGTLEAQYLYFPFGEDLGEHPEIIYNPLRFAGAYRDMQRGTLNKYQYYLSAGYHDPTYGRLAQAINRYPNFPAVSRTPLSYAYAGNNPARLTGRSGRHEDRVKLEWFFDVVAILGDVASFAPIPVIAVPGYVFSVWGALGSYNLAEGMYKSGLIDQADMNVARFTFITGFVPWAGIFPAAAQYAYDRGWQPVKGWMRRNIGGGQ